MQILKRPSFFIFVACALVVPFSAYAYLDPGTGSFIIQIIIAAVATAAISVKVFWQKIKELFSRFFKHSDGTGK